MNMVYMGMTELLRYRATSTSTPTSPDMPYELLRAHWIAEVTQLEYNAELDKLQEVAADPALDGQLQRYQLYSCPAAPARIPTGPRWLRVDKRAPHLSKALMAVSAQTRSWSARVCKTLQSPSENALVKTPTSPGGRKPGRSYIKKRTECWLGR